VKDYRSVKIIISLLFTLSLTGIATEAEHHFHEKKLSNFDVFFAFTIDGTEKYFGFVPPVSFMTLMYEAYP
jgi:hypothetical protein